MYILWVKKLDPFSFEHNFHKYCLILIILSMLQTEIICPLTHSLTAALDQLRVVASSTSNDPGPRSRQHQQIGQRLLPLAAANFSVDDPVGASSQQREECRCGLLLTVEVPVHKRVIQLATLPIVCCCTTYVTMYTSSQKLLNKSAMHVVISLLLQSRKFWWYLSLSSSMLLHDIIVSSYWRHSAFTCLQRLLIYFSRRKIMWFSNKDKILIKNLHDSKGTGGTAPKN